MRPALRALLLATGFAVMVATSPSPTPFTISVWIPTGGAETVTFSAKSEDGKKQVRPLVRVRPWRGADGTGTVRLVGITSSARPPSEAYSQLDPKASFTVGQSLEGLGTVAFVHEVPFNPDPATLVSDPLPLPDDETVFLTVFSPDTNLEATLTLAVPEMEEQCQCEVGETYPEAVHHYQPPAPPDSGTDGGTDGGTGGSDGG